MYPINILTVFYKRTMESIGKLLFQKFLSLWVTWYINIFMPWAHQISYILV